MIIQEEILTALKPYNSISLEKMNKVKLMNRIDNKYVTTIDKINNILNLNRKDYFVYKENNNSIFTYNNQYYDTIDYKMYIEHHNQRLPREKIRIRNYLNSQDSFLEVKRKNNQGRTIKNRIKINLKSTQDQNGYVNKESKYNFDELSPSLETTFSRITLVNKSFKERLTIDFHIKFHNPRTNNNFEINNLIIIELKQECRSFSQTKEILNLLSIRPSGFSKYCVGQALTNTNIKQNLFKSKIYNLKK